MCHDVMPGKGQFSPQYPQFPCSPIWNPSESTFVEHQYPSVSFRQTLWSLPSNLNGNTQDVLGDAPPFVLQDVEVSIETKIIIIQYVFVATVVTNVRIIYSIYRKRYDLHQNQVPLHLDVLLRLDRLQLQCNTIFHCTIRLRIHYNNRKLLLH